MAKLREVGLGSIYRELLAVKPYGWIQTADPMKFEEDLRLLSRNGFLVLTYSRGRGLTVADATGVGGMSAVGRAVPDSIKELWSTALPDYTTALGYITGFFSETSLLSSSVDDDPAASASFFSDLASVLDELKTLSQTDEKLKQYARPAGVIVHLPGFDAALSTPNEDVAMMVSALTYGGRRLRHNSVIPVTVIASAVSEPPEQIKPFFEVFQYELPREESFKAKFKAILTAYKNAYARAGSPGKIQKGYKALAEDEQFVSEVVKNAAGMRMTDFEHAVKIAVNTLGGRKFFEKLNDPKEVRLLKKEFVRTIWNQKVRYVDEVKGLELYKPTEQDKFDMIGGLEPIKDFIRKTIRSPLAKGILLTGIPGTGKSSIAKAVGYEMGVPVLRLSLQQVYHGIVGATEANLALLLQTVDRMAPCVLFIDEIEKQLAGYHSSHATDGGVTSRVMGTLLEWMNDRTSQVYVIGTANNPSLLPPEFRRAGRWDAVFFLDFPGEEERKQIWKIWRKFYRIPDEAKTPRDVNWTGADISSCCRLARMFLDSDGTTPERCLIDAAKNVQLVYKQLGSYESLIKEAKKFAIIVGGDSKAFGKMTDEHSDILSEAVTGTIDELIAESNDGGQMP